MISKVLIVDLPILKTRGDVQNILMVHTGQTN